MKLKQGSIEDPSVKIQKSIPPSSTSEGASQGGRPKEMPRSEPRSNPNVNCTETKAIHQCRTSEGAYFRVIPRWTQTNEPSKKPFSANQKPEFNSYTKNWFFSKNEIWKNKSGYSSNTTPCDPWLEKQETSNIIREKTITHTNIIPDPESTMWQH